jgi:hypothetical protein
MSDSEFDSDGDYFSSARVRELQNEDFALESTEGLTLFAEGCSIVLFYNNSSTSAGLAEIWADLSAEFTDVNFFGVNLMQRRDIAKRIGGIRNDVNHMFNKFTLARPPYILAYRESLDPQISYPQAFYNGAYDTQSIAEWISEVGCQPGETEFVSDTATQAYEGDKNVIIDEDVDEMGNPRSIVSREYYGSKSTAVQRVLASRARELENLQLSPDDYDMMTPTRDPTFKPNKRVTSTRGVGYVNF